MPSLTIPVRTSWVLTWTLTDSQGNPINTANVTANLYSGRLPANPQDVPGTLVPPIVNIALVYNGGGAGQYSATIPATLNPLPNGVGYTLVIDATVGSTPVYHFEQPAAVETAGSVLDLTTLDQVKAYLPGLTPGVATADDALIQSLITSWGYEFLSRTGQGDQSGDYQQSPFTAVGTFNETYDGKGTYRLFVKNRPIVNVTSVIINGVSIMQSGAVGVGGYVVDGTGKSIALRQGVIGWGSPSPTSWNYQSGPFAALGVGLKFWVGIQNVNVQYSAGYAFTPSDITLCANLVVTQNYKRRNWIDEASRAMAAGGGTVRYRDWDIPPEAERVVERYSRTL